MSEDPADYRRAAGATAKLEVWLEVVHTMPDMRFWVAHNKTVPLPVLEVLAQDADPRVRSMVAAKRSLSPELALQIAADPEPSVQAALARNRGPAIGEAVLKLLARASSELVTQALTSRSKDHPRNDKSGPRGPSDVDG